MEFNNMKVMTESAILKMIPDATNIQSINQLLVYAAKLPNNSAKDVAEILEARIKSSPFNKQQRNRAINNTRNFRKNPEKVATQLISSR